MSLTKIVLAAALLAAPAARAAECAPAQMVRVTYRDITPGRTASPITMHRLGERYGRVEEQKNPTTGQQNLMIVAEPDVWFVNLADQTGKHMIDPGPVLEFRAPILNSPGTPPLFAKLETGCELDFLETFAPRPVGQETVEDEVLDRHEVSLGQDRLEVMVRQGQRKVYSVTHYRGQGVQTRLRYLDYALGLAPDMSLFAKPVGVTFKTEAPAP